jgi:8-oxo-dGTP pyrophosphatase MutT (NUDIX family)
MTDAPPEALERALKRLNDEERKLEAHNIRPKDAATLLILDRAAGGPTRVLMGRRHMRHRFFPGAYVFPGGRVDPGDGRVAVADGYRPDVGGQLALQLKGPKGPARVRAFGVAALRETWEEAGLLIGTAPARALPRLPEDFAAFGARGLLPALDPLRFVARAITPPRRPRRFDTRFLACFADAIAARSETGVGPSGELEDVAWLTFEEAKRTAIPSITMTVLDEVAYRLEADPRLERPGPVPFYAWRGNSFTRAVI